MLCTAGTTIRYRMKFGRDLIVDMQHIIQSVDPEGNIKDDFDFGVVENFAYITAKQANPDKVPDDVLDWFDGFDDMMALYDPDIIGSIVEMWVDDQETIEKAKKKQANRKATNDSTIYSSLLPGGYPTGRS